MVFLLCPRTRVICVLIFTFPSRLYSLSLSVCLSLPLFRCLSHSHSLFLSITNSRTHPPIHLLTHYSLTNSDGEERTRQVTLTTAVCWPTLTLPARSCWPTRALYPGKIYLSNCFKIMMYKIYLKKRACLRFFINYLFVIFLYYVVVLFYLFYISLRCFMEVFVFLIERTRCRSHRVRASTGSCLRRSTSWLNTDPLVTSLVTGRSHTLYYFEILYSIDPLFCDIVLYRYTVIY